MDYRLAQVLEGNQMAKQDKEDLIAFLNGLEDSDLLSNPIYSQPWVKLFAFKILTKS